MSRKSKSEFLNKQAQRLFAQRVYFATHCLSMLMVLLLTRGRLVRLEPVFIIWTMFLMLHAVYFALYENREAVLRQNYKADKERDSAFIEGKNDDADDEVYYTIGTDGELIPLDEDDEVNHHVE